MIRRDSSEAGARGKAQNDGKKAPSGRELSPQVTEGDCFGLNNKKVRKAPSTVKAVPLPLRGRLVKPLFVIPKRAIFDGLMKNLE